MSIHINQSKCIGCKQCVNVCPGSLFVVNDSGKAEMKYPKDCWGCASCIKECPVRAISMYLGADMGGTGALLSVNMTGEQARWILEQKEGEQIVINVNRQDSNQY